MTFVPPHSFYSPRSRRKEADEPAFPTLESAQEFATQHFPKGTFVWRHAVGKSEHVSRIGYIGLSGVSTGEVNDVNPKFSLIVEHIQAANDDVDLSGGFWPLSEVGKMTNEEVMQFRKPRRPR